MLYVKFKRLTETAQIPKQGSANAAGYDLCADLPESVIIRPGECQQIWTGLAMEIPSGYFGAIYARSGLATKQGLRPPNCVGVIDSDYRGNIGIPLYNDSEHDQIVHPGQRIAQIVIQPHERVIWQDTEHISETDRAGNGFGSTGA
jgi:dUTP pyrophosphatase